MSKSSLFQRWFLPGFLFQSVIIGGGYATGRELVEFFLSAGPLGGLVSILTVTATFSICMAIGFELARVTRRGGRVAVTIPTATSENLYLRVGDDYFESLGGHIRIFRPRQLADGLARRRGGRGAGPVSESGAALGH